MVDVWHTASYADCSLSRGFRSINALLAANVCKGKIHIAHFLKFVKVNSTRDEIGVDFSFSIKAIVNKYFYRGQTIDKKLILEYNRNVILARSLKIIILLIMF